jgi:hypothetical protein
MQARLLLGALALALTMAGSGGDDEDSGNGTSGESAPRVSKAEFIEQADELCTDFRENSDELAAKADATSDTGRQAEIWRELVLLLASSSTSARVELRPDETYVPSGG